MSKERKGIKEYNHFYCVNCKSGPMDSIEKVKAHLLDVHHIDITDKQFTRSMLSHIDARDYYQWKYLWKIEDVELEQETLNKRTGEDAEMWA